MGVTAIKRIVNRTNHQVRAGNKENSTKFKNGALMNPHTEAEVDMWIPWNNIPSEYFRHHIWVEISGNGFFRRFTIYQSQDVDGDFVRSSVASREDDPGSGGSPGFLIPGVDEVNGDRRLVITENSEIRLERL